MALRMGRWRSKQSIGKDSVKEAKYKGGDSCASSSDHLGASFAWYVLLRCRNFLSDIKARTSAWYQHPSLRNTRDMPFLICSPSSNCFCNAAGSVVLEFSTSQPGSSWRQWRSELRKGTYSQMPALDVYWIRNLGQDYSISFPSIHRGVVDILIPP